MLVQKKLSENLKAFNQSKREAQLRDRRSKFSSENETKMAEETKETTETKKNDPALGSVTITLTYGDRAENHPGMQKIGELAKEGFSVKDLNEAKSKFEEKGLKCELIDLNEGLKGTGRSGDAAVLLIVRKALNSLHQTLNANKMFEEQINLTWDAKMLNRYRKVVNKRARRNLCYAEESQEPDYEKGKGTIVPFKNVPYTSLVRDLLGDYYLGEKGRNLTCEGNLYYDVKKCGVSFHGDDERRKVVGVRLGAELPLHFQWFFDSSPIGERIKLTLGHGDLYVMSEKAVGFDSKLRKTTTLRHAAGCPKFLVIKEKKKSEPKKESKPK